MALFKLCLKVEMIFQLFFACSRDVCYCLPVGKSFLRGGITSYKAQHDAFVEICTPVKHFVKQALNCIET